MEDRSELDVLICGAGAAGLTLALELARRSIRFCLIDKISSPFGGSRGKGIQPRTLEIFEDLGVVNRIAAIGGAYPTERHYHDDGSYTDSLVSDARPINASEPYAAPLMVPQFLTELVLRERLAELGHAPRYACELVDFVHDAQGVTAQIKGADGVKTIRTRYLVAADGGRSFIRHKLSIDFPGKSLGVRAIVADVSLDGLDNSVWHRFNEASMAKHVSLCPLAGTSLFQLQAPIALEGDVDLSAPGLNEMIAQRTGQSHIKIDSVFWASAYSMNARLADHYRIENVFLVGDAAHIHPPTGGQGLNTSVQDAYNLGWKLAAVINGASQKLLDSYEDERRPIAAGMLGLSAKLLDAAKTGDHRRGRETQQLDLCYSNSSLVQTSFSKILISSGQRAPDALFQGAGGQSVRLFEIFKGTHWTLLAYGVNRASLPSWPGVDVHTIAGSGSLHDQDGHFADTYGVSDGDLVIVRPDGYIGTTTGEDEVNVISDYLLKVGITPET